MDALRIVIVVITVIGAVGLLALFVMRNSPGRGNTETPTNNENRDSPNDRYYATSDRPAGPDAEDMYVSGDGSIGPGPTGQFDPASVTPDIAPPTADPSAPTATQDR